MSIAPQVNHVNPNVLANSVMSLFPHGHLTPMVSAPIFAPRKKKGERNEKGKQRRKSSHIIPKVFADLNYISMSYL